MTHHTPERQAQVFDKDSGTAGLVAIANQFDGLNVRHVFTTEPIWVGKDVCAAIGIAKPRDALVQLDADERASIAVDTLGGVQNMTGVTEAGVWSLMLISRSPKVKPFKRWLTHEVLPSIRKTGKYNADIQLPDRKLLAQWVVEAETKLELAEAKIGELKPPANAWTELANAAGDYSVSDAAKVLNRNPSIKTGERKLYNYMSSIGWVFKRDGRWKAYQEHVNNGRLAEKVGKPFWHEGRMVNDAPTVRITPKGLEVLQDRMSGQLTIA